MDTISGVVLLRSDAGARETAVGEGEEAQTDSAWAEEGGGGGAPTTKGTPPIDDRRLQIFTDFLTKIDAKPTMMRTSNIIDTHTNPILLPAAASVL
jgi:hypothetical protein